MEFDQTGGSRTGTEEPAVGLPNGGSRRLADIGSISQNAPHGASYTNTKVNYLSVSGLLLDMAGVVLLGIDLVRVQRKLRTDAEERLSTLSEVTEATGGLDKFLASISGDWREYERTDEGYRPRHGTFDYDSAERSLDEIKDGINGLADNLSTVATMMVTAVEGDRKTASMSLKVSYGGMALIVCGFILQIPGYL